MTEQAKRIGDWIQTASGVAFWPMDPRPEEIRIEDIAHALSHLCRFGGHSRSFYSVSQHSVLVSQNVEPEHALWALLHDATEAYLVDVPRPLKRFLAGYVEIENRLMSVIAAKFGLPPEMPAEVKESDNRILVDEANQLLGPKPMPWSNPAMPLGIRICPWSPAEAKAAFLSRFDELTGLR